MRIIKPSYEIMTPVNREEILKTIEIAGRTCYKSEDKITEDSASKFVKNLVNRGHEAMIEHVSLTVKFICDRGVSHEIVRHRIASFAQESTRYVSSANKQKININNDEDCINAYLNGLSMKKISEKSNNKYTEWDIYKILDNHNIEKRNLGRRGIINSNYFEIIDTPEKAYLLGFIMADGNVRRNSPQITITQKENEQWYLLNMIKTFIQPEAKTLSFHDKKIWEDIINKGIIPNKTYEFNETHAELLWNSINEKYIHDFLRGLLDGDGSIRWFYQKENSNSKSCNICFNGNYHILNKIKQLLKEQYNYETKIHNSDSEYMKRLFITDSNVGYQFCINIYNNFKFPYGHSKTANWYGAFDLDVPLLSNNNDKFIVIKPLFFNDKSLWIWGNAMFNSELSYNNLIQSGASPQEARSVLPNSLKTEIVVTMNLREWRHFFRLRCAKTAHPQMREITIPLLEELREKLPEIFGDIVVEE
jgi:thymidylate synthase ThyX